MLNALQSLDELDKDRMKLESALHSLRQATTWMALSTESMRWNTAVIPVYAIARGLAQKHPHEKILSEIRKIILLLQEGATHIAVILNQKEKPDIGESIVRRIAEQTAERANDLLSVTEHACRDAESKK